MLRSIISHFSIPGEFFKAERFGSGLINDTYICLFNETGTIQKYILQKINTTVFKFPQQVMENVELVTTHIANKLREDGVPDPWRTTPALIHSRDGRSYHRNGQGDYWRMFHFIEDGAVFDTITGIPQAYQIGRGVGKFQSLVSGLAPSKLNDTLPGFHHTPRYLAECDDALKTDPADRAFSVASEAAFISSRRALAPLLTDLMDRGEIPIRVVHNDPKVNNVMVHAKTGEAMCMLDLDTVKPGIIHFDFGDCLRSAANRAGEDAEDLGRVTLDLELFEAVTRGYLREAGGFLTEKEIELLPASVKVITFELGLRFLTDYIRGDRYFRVKHPGHNLHRARVQFRLLETIEEREKEMRAIIEKMQSGNN